MLTLFKPADTPANKISFGILALLLASIPFDMFYSHVLLIAFALHTLIHLKRENLEAALNRQTLVLPSIYWLALFSTPYTTNLPQAWADLVRLLPVLMFPVLLAINGLSLRLYRNALPGTLMLACTTYVVYLYIQAFTTLHYYGLPPAAIVSPAFINHNFCIPIGIHATYFSILVAFGFTYALWLAINSKGVIRFAVAICALVLGMGLIQLGSKAVLVATVIILNLAFPWFISAGKPRMRFIITVLLGTLALAGGIYSSGSLKSRYVGDLQYDLGKATPQELTDPRLARWKVAFTLACQKPLLGHGTGTELNLLKEGYYGNGLLRSYLANLNAHNQYLSLLIESGVLGLLVYLYTLFWGLRQAIRNSSLLLIAFIILITSVSLAENILDTDKGVFIYSTLFSILIVGNTNKTRNNKSS